MRKILVICTCLIFPLFLQEGKAQVRELRVADMAFRIDSVIQEGIRQEAYPGAQFVVAQNGEVIYNKCYGVHSRKTPLPVKSVDLYDLASVTKASATLLAVMRLYEQGKLDLNEKASFYLPFYRNTDKENITVTDLLFHESGLPSTLPFYYSIMDPDTYKKPLVQNQRDADHPGQLEQNLFISNFKYKENAFSKKRDKVHTLPVYKDMWLDKCYMDTLKLGIAACPYTFKHYQYSDLGFISLQWIVESLTARSLDNYVEEEFYKPMKAKRTMFLPARRYPLSEIVPTVTDDCLRNVDEIVGYTQDEVAAFMGGVAGEAGLFSTATDLCRIFQMFLNGGVLEGKRYFKTSTIDLFTTTRSSISHRGLGFDRPNLKHPNESPCISEVPASTYGHSGFTGTNVWVDPQNQLVYVFLCNRVSPYPWNNRLNELDIFGGIQRAIYDNLH